MSERIIDVYDNVLPESDAKAIDDVMSKMMWGYGHWKSDWDKNSYHWTRWCGKTPEEIIENGMEFVLNIWNTFHTTLDFKSKYDLDTFDRIYMNAHTFGIEPNIHTDDGDFTMIYYPNLAWKSEWGGGTMFYDTYQKGYRGSVAPAQYCAGSGTPAGPIVATKTDEVPIYNLDKLVDCKPNRLVVFDAQLPHMGQSVIRDCFELRYVIVFKGSVRAFNREGLDFYKDNSSKR